MELKLRVRGSVLSAVLMGLATFVLAGGLAFAGSHSSAASKRGEPLFRHDCAGCHNKQPGDTTPFGPPNLHGIFQRKALTPAQARNIIRHGRAAMPSFGSLSNSQINDLLAYLKTQ